MSHKSLYEGASFSFSNPVSRDLYDYVNNDTDITNSTLNTLV